MEQRQLSPLTISFSNNTSIPERSSYVSFNNEFINYQNISQHPELSNDSSFKKLNQINESYDCKRKISSISSNIFNNKTSLFENNQFRKHTDTKFQQQSVHTKSMKINSSYCNNSFEKPQLIDKQKKPQKYYYKKEYRQIDPVDQEYTSKFKQNRNPNLKSNNPASYYSKIPKSNNHSHQIMNISQSNQFSFVSNNMKWQFDLALNQQISQRIQNSMNNESKVIAFHEIYLQDIVARIFMQWKLLTHNKQIQQNQYIIQNENSNSQQQNQQQNNHSFITHNHTQYQKLSHPNPPKTGEYQQQSKNHLLQPHKSEIKQKQNSLNNFWNDRIYQNKLQLFQVLKNTYSRWEGESIAQGHRNRVLLSQVFRAFKMKVESKNLRIHLNQVSQMNYRKTLLEKGFYGLYYMRRDDVLEIKNKTVQKLRIKKCINTMYGSTIIKRKIIQLYRVVSKKKKRSRDLYQNKLQIGWYVLKKAFDRFRMKSSMSFQKDLFVYSIQKFHQIKLLKKCFGLWEQNYEKRRYPPKTIKDEQINGIEFKN